MKVTKLTIQNIGPIADMAIELNKPLMLFYGEIRQGKTTILNCVRWVMGGAFPSDIIQHGKADASIQLDFENGSVRREFYVGKDGTTKAREIVFERDGRPVSNPVKELKSFLNPFLLNQDYLRDMTEPERKRYFVSVLGADTSEIDNRLAAMEQVASTLRAKLSGYGEIDLTPVMFVDVGAIKATIKTRVDLAEDTRAALRHIINEVRDKQEASRAGFAALQTAADTRRLERDRARGDLEVNCKRIESLRSQIAALEDTNKSINAWLEANPRLEPPAALVSDPGEILSLEAQLAAVQPDVAALEQSLREAYANNARYEHHVKELAREDMRRNDEAQLHAVLQNINSYRRERIAFLSSLNNKIPGLCFDEAGNLTYEGTHAGMLSTAQVMQLSSALSALYPEGFGLDLIDRAESLGKSIFSFVEKAKREEKTILATIVGEKPATAPAEVGVFVVENGGLK
jgi:DNA repair exonuclease SbcCD ATPase subunit